MSRGLKAPMAWAALLASAPLLIAAAPQKAGPASAIDVVAADFQFGLQPPKVRAGQVTFRVRNVGSSPHDFVINGAATRLLANGESDTLRVQLAPGIYAFVCSVPGHQEAGMKGTLVVENR